MPESDAHFRGASEQAGSSAPDLTHGPPTRGPHPASLTCPVSTTLTLLYPSLFLLGPHMVPGQARGSPSARRPALPESHWASGKDLRSGRSRATQVPPANSRSTRQRHLGTCLSTAPLSRLSPTLLLVLQRSGLSADRWGSEDRRDHALWAPVPWTSGQHRGDAWRLVALRNAPLGRP